ncbi:MAG: four helix bundle protein [Candidatus Saccharibacteria bacterium]|nr:four helix bundle protein [Candidatus Saccharibacteria bacterium]
MKINSFEDILAWKKAKDLTVAVYKTTKSNKDNGFNSQLQRAAVSIMNNIAEGFERQSNKEFKKFLYIAKGSCGEVRSMLRLGQSLETINEDSGKILIDQSIEISKLLSGLIKKL